jgi:hypothetical protein
VTLSPKTDPISISRLAQDLGVSRPAIYNNDLKDVVRDYRERQRANFEVEAEARARRAPLEQAVPKLKTKNRELRARLDGLAQWWVYWARYALRHGIKPDLMFPDGGPEDTEWPVPPPPDVPQARRREPGRRQAARSKR